MTLLRYFGCLILFLNLYMEATGDLRKLSWRLVRNEKERLLEKFLIDAETNLMQNCPNRHTTIIALNNKFLRAATSLFKIQPYFVATDSKVIVQSREYANENCVFVFVDIIDYDYLSTIFSYLPKDYNTKVQIVSTINQLRSKVKNILDLAYNNSVENITITFLESNEFKAFQIYPFIKDCENEIGLSYVWTPDNGLQTFYYDTNFPRDLNKCTIPITTVPEKNVIIVRKNNDGTLEILGGFEGNLILAFAEKLNFTATVKYSQTRKWEQIIRNTTSGLLLEDIASGNSMIAIGQLLPTLVRHEYSDFTTSYDYGCIVWTTSATTAFTENILYSEFGTYMWAAVVISIIFSSIFIYNLTRISSNNHEKPTYIGVTLDVTYASLGFPVHQLPTNQPEKIYFLSYIFYAIVATTAYQTYLASVLTVSKDAQLIRTDADIVRWKLIPGGSSNALSVLKSQRQQSPYMPYLIDNFEIFVNTVAALDRIKYRKDYAFAKDISVIEYYKRDLILSGKEVYFYSFDECIVSFHKCILVHKGSALTDQLNIIIVRLREFGLLHLWKNEKDNADIRKRHESDITLRKLNLQQLKSIFILYVSGIILSSFIMLLEIIFEALSKNKESK